MDKRNTYEIYVDASVDIENRYIEENDIHFIPMKYMIDDKEYVMDRQQTEEELEQIASVSCAMVGDRKFDVNGAKALRVTSVAVSYGYAPEGELEACEPDYLVHTVEELGKVLAQD